MYFDFPHPGSAIKRIFEYVMYGYIDDESYLWHLLEPLERNLTAYSFLTDVKYVVSDKNGVVQETVAPGEGGGQPGAASSSQSQFEDEYYEDDETGAFEYYDENPEDDYYEDYLPGDTGSGGTSGHQHTGEGGDDEYYDDMDPFLEGGVNGEDEVDGEDEYYEDDHDGEEDLEDADKVLCVESFFDDSTQSEHIEMEVWVVEVEAGDRKRVYYNEASDTTQVRKE